VVIAIEVIEHLRPEIYGEIRRILKENGLFIVTTPQPWSEPLLHLLKRLKLITWVDEEDAQHINPVKVESLPFRLVDRRNIYLLDQFGVLRA
jgi:spermidine synthase